MYCFFLAVLLSPGVAAAQCAAPLVSIPGGCCWQGQTVVDGECTGTPTCPSGTHAVAARCAPDDPNAVRLGPAPEPVTPAPAPPVTTQWLNYGIEYGGGPGPLTLYVARGTVWQATNYVRACTAPCTFTGVPGMIELGVSSGTGTTLSAGLVELPSTPSILRLSYLHRGPERVVGILLLTAGLLAGTIVTSWGAALVSSPGRLDEGRAWLVTGVGTMGVSFVLGFALSFLFDGVIVEVEPAAP